MSITSEMNEYIRRAKERENLPGQVFSYTPPPLVKQVMDALKFFNLKECHIKVNDDGSIDVQAKIIDANAKSTEE